MTSFQVGAFADEANAAALARELAGKGFSGFHGQARAGGPAAMGRPGAAGADPQATLMRLKDAGYEAYPIF